MSEVNDNDSARPQDIIVTQSIPITGLKKFIEIYLEPSSTPIEVKRTTRAKLSRTNIPAFDYYPHCILPATGHIFRVKMDQNGKFVLSRDLPKVNSPGPLYTLPKSYRNAPDVVLDFKQANELMELIHYVQQYLIQTHERLTSTGKQYVLIPFSLYNMYNYIEDILSSGWTESTYNLLKEAKTEVENFVKNRTDELATMAKQLTIFIDSANGKDPPAPTILKNSVMF